MRSYMNHAVAKCAAAVVLLALAAPAWAQQGNIRRLTFYKVRPDRVAEFRDATKQLNEAVKKANGNRGFTMWQSASGPNEYVGVSYYEKWADLEFTQNPQFQAVAGQISAAVARRNDTLAAPSTSVIDEIMPDHSIFNRNLALDQMPKMVRVVKVSVRSEKINEYSDLVKNESLPVYKKAGKKLYMLSRTRYGAPTREFRSVTDIAGWADMDKPNPFVMAVGEAGYRAYLAKLSALATNVEVNMYRFVPDLSYFPAAPGRPSGN